MKKILDYLELNVQWLVLGISVLYVLYMLWSYVFVPPVVVNEIAAEPLSPSEVDAHIYSNVAAVLEMKMKDPRVPSFQEPSFVPEFLTAMNLGGVQAELWADARAMLPPSGMIKTATPASDGTASPGVTVPGGAVARLPEVPPAILTNTRSGLSNVLLTPQQPDQPLPVGATGVDKSWVTIRFEIDPTAIANAWDQCQIPPQLAATSFLQVVLERQEQNPDGTWGAITIVPPLANQQLPPFPDASAASAAIWQYLTWASSHQADILQPPFYQVVKGESWAVPGESVATAAVQEVFDPTRYIDAPYSELMKLTPEQRRQVAAAQAKKKQEELKAKRASTPAAPPPSPTRRPPGGYRPGGPAPDSEYGPNDPVRPPAPARPPAPGGYGAPYGPPPGFWGPPEEAPSEYVPTTPQMTGFPVPANEFDPRKWASEHPEQPKIVGWAHDDTVIPGRTYRYRVTYKIKNPIFSARNVASNPKLADVFALVSLPSQWSEKIVVTSTINFWIARSPRTGASTVSIQVFRWQGGQPRTKTYDLAPGDAIGLKEAETDFATGWTLVDIRTDPRTEEPYVLLMDPSGLVHRRDTKTDSMDPKYQEYKQQAAASVSSAAPVEPGAGVR